MLVHLQKSNKYAIQTYWSTLSDSSRLDIITISTGLSHETRSEIISDWNRDIHIMGSVDVVSGEGNVALGCGFVPQGTAVGPGRINPPQIYPKVLW